MKFIFLFIVIISANIFAMPIIKNPELSNTVANIYHMLINKEYDKRYDLAAEYCQKILDSKNVELQKELKELKSTDGAPYSLRLHLIRLDCLTHLGKRSEGTFREECKKIIDKYKEQAKNNNWQSFVGVYSHFACHYSSIHIKKMEMDIWKEGADALPMSNLPVRYAYNIMNNYLEPITANIVSEVKRMIKKNKEVS